MWPEAAIYIPWDVWILTWIVAAVWVNRTLKRPAFGSEWPYRILEFGGLAVLLGTFSESSDDFRKGLVDANPLAQRYWALSSEVGWVMVSLTVAGFLFAWWARLHLGRLWSGRITRKDGHHVVSSGPYAIVRHPIYTGILLASAATAAEKGSGYAILGLTMIIVGYWLKARLEERFLRAELGAAAYDDYARKTAMLIPFLRV